MKKRNEAAAEEAKLALEDFDSLSKQLEGLGGAEDLNGGPSSGRMVFNAAGKQAPKPNKSESDNKSKLDNFYDNSDCENDLEAEDNDYDAKNESNDLHKDLIFESNVLHEVSQVHQNGLFKVIISGRLPISWSVLFMTS